MNISKLRGEAISPLPQSPANVREYDLIVAGLGIAGSMAAVAAGRLGLRVAAFDYSGFPGGALTSSGVGPMMTFHAGTTQVIRGITSELIDRLVKKGLSPGHQPDTTGFTYSVTPFDYEGMKRELELMLHEAGVEILYHTLLDEVYVRDGKIDGLSVLTKSAKVFFNARWFIDATGEAELAFRAGADCTFGRPGDGQAQPMTMKLRVHGVDIHAVRDYMEKNPEEFHILKGRTNMLQQASRLSCLGYNSILKKAIAAGELSFERETVLFFETNNPGEVIINMGRLLGKNAVDPWSLSGAETQGRDQAWELFNFFRAHIPGFSRAQMSFTGPFVGIRSSRQIVGIHTITAEELFEQRQFYDFISHCGYPIDIHSPDGTGTEHRFFAYGAYYNVPLRAMLVPKICNIVVTGRCISADFAAQASLRLSPHAGALGHAAGAAIALSHTSDTPLVNLDPVVLRNILKSQDAFLDEHNGAPSGSSILCEQVP